MMESQDVTTKIAIPTTMQPSTFDQNEDPEYGRRIPVTLQSVIVSSNRGRSIKKPPPEFVANRVFTRKWFFQRRVDAKFDSSESSPCLSSPVKSPRKVVGKATLPLSPRRQQPPAVPELESVFVPKPIAPQTYFESVLQSRGYSITAVKATECAYYNKVTQLQEASYGSFLVETIRMNDPASLRELLEVGLSPNASNVHNESIVHLACRMGYVDILKTLMDFGCRLQISDDNGRTPLHEACWAASPCFELIEMLLEADRYMLLVADARGRLPLNYVREDNWAAFTRFLMKKKDDLWPDKLLGETAKSGSLFLRERPHSQHIMKNPKRHISIQMARLVAQGKMSPAEVEFLTKGVDAREDDAFNSSDDDVIIEEPDSSNDENDEDCDGKDTNGEDNDDDDDDNSSCISFDEKEMADLLASIGSLDPVDWS